MHQWLSSPTTRRTRFAATAAAALVLPALLINGAKAEPEQACTVEPGGVVYAESCPGANAGEQIGAALGALEGSSGTVNARGLHGTQQINIPLTLGSPAGQWSVQLLLGPGRWVFADPITVLMQSSIVGAPVGKQVGRVDAAATTLIAANGMALPAVVRVGDGSGLGGFNAVLEDIVVDGNKAGGGTSPDGAAILATGGGRAELTRVTAQRSAGDGILIDSTQASSNCCANITKVMAIANDGAGFHLRGEGNRRPNDVMVEQSSFENNLGAGVQLDDASGFRIDHSDMGGNAVGLRTDGVSGAQIITNNQFGNQHGHDILMNGTGFSSIINDNFFIGSGFRPPDSAAIQLRGASGTTIAGNFINMIGAGTAADLAAGIRLIESEGRNLVMSNTFSGGSPEIDIVGDGVFPPHPDKSNLMCRAASDSDTGC